MPGSSIGKIFKVTTFGESHGKAIGVIVEGVPPFMELTEADVQADLNRRRPGQSKIATPRNEKDAVEIVSGVFDGRTMGPPIAMLIRNQNQDPGAYINFKHKFRPGHADYPYMAKYGIRDWRGSGRASGRETACRVAAGAIAKKVLETYGVKVVGMTKQIGDIVAEAVDYDLIEQNIARTADASVVDAMIDRIEQTKANENSIGGIAEVHVLGCPAGIGDPVFDKIEATIAHAVMSVGAVKGVEVGVGFDCAEMLGSEYNDELYMDGENVRTRTNNAGGITGGISTGETITVRAAIRPPASISKQQATVNIDGGDETIEVHGRHDPCIVPRAVPVLEAMIAIVLADALLIQEAYKKHKPPISDAADFLKREWKKED